MIEGLSLPKMPKAIFVAIIFVFVAAPWKLAMNFRPPKDVEKAYVTLPKYGQVLGRVQRTFKGKPVRAFLGIPYSRAKRFEGFAEPEPWKDVFDATRFGVSCQETSYEALDTSARCLCINVLSGHDEEGLAPVLVYFHGGGFWSGSGSSEDLTYFLESDIVAVTFNYRLGPLGFLHSTDPAAEIEGNYGLKDQVYALKWVHDNIAAFGGDPNRVTIMGVSAGAASVDLLTLIPNQTAGLFHRAITISGAATCPWAIQTKPQETFIKYAKVVGCMPNDQKQPSQDTYHCLRTKEQSTMMLTWPPQFQVWSEMPFTFVPSVDGRFIQDWPENILKQGSFLRIPMLMGINKDEGFAAAGDAPRSKATMKILRTHWKHYCPAVLELGRLNNSEAKQACATAHERYLGSEAVDFENFYQFVKMTGSRLFGVPQQRRALAHAAYAPVFGYRNEYQAERGQWTHYYDVTPQDVPRLKAAVPHFGEWAMIFAVLHDPIKPGEPDVWIHEFFMGTYLSFIKTGVPTVPRELGYDLTWPQFTPRTRRIQVIDKNPRIDTNFATKDEDDFWRSYGL